MTKKQKLVIIIFCVVLAMMLAYPPFYSERKARFGISWNLGYHFILDPPGQTNKYSAGIGDFRTQSTVNIWLLAVQYLFVVTIGVGLLFVLKPKDK